MGMRFPLSGIVTGFRVRKDSKGSDFAQLDIVQAGTKNFESSLTFVYVDRVDFMEFLLENYSNGHLKMINVYVAQVQQGRETLLVLQEIYELSQDRVPVEA